MVASILKDLRSDKSHMFKNNSEEFITKMIKLIEEQKATMIVEHISYDQLEVVMIVAETKGTMDRLNFRLIEQAKKNTLM